MARGSAAATQTRRHIPVQQDYFLPEDEAGGRISEEEDIVSGSEGEEGEDDEEEGEESEEGDAADGDGGPLVRM
jgi:hypothetical protein